jgi:hypothetical protein
MRWLIVATVQVASIWAVCLLWQHVAPVLGFVGLAAWLAGSYALADWLDRDADRRFLADLRQRGWKGPPSSKNGR